MFDSYCGNIFKRAMVFDFIMPAQFDIVGDDHVFDDVQQYKELQKERDSVYDGNDGEMPGRLGKYVWISTPPGAIMEPTAVWVTNLTAVGYECTRQVMFRTNPRTWKEGMFWERTYAEIAKKMNKTAENRRKSPRIQPDISGTTRVRIWLGTLCKECTRSERLITRYP